MKHPTTDPLAALKNVDWLISNGGEISLGAFGSVECAAVASDESDCLDGDRRTLTDLLGSPRFQGNK